MDPRRLDGTGTYRIDGLAPGPWRLVWADRSESVFTNPGGKVKALVRLDSLDEIGPGHLRYLPG